MPRDLARVDAMIARTELQIDEQTARLRAPDVALWMRDTIYRRLWHMRRDLETFRKARNLIVVGDEWTS